MSSKIVVVGGGIAGLAAAMEAQAAGAQVIVFDKLKTLKNCTYFSGGGQLEKLGAPEVIVEAARRTSGDQVDVELWRAFAEGLDESIDWLQSIGVQWYEAVPVTGQVPGVTVMRLRVKGHGIGLMATIEGAAKAQGVPIEYQARAVELKRDSRGRVVGIRAERLGKMLELSADAVILASGGFQGNKEMVAQHIGPWLTKLKLSGTPLNTGDGHIMALEAGARLTHTDQWHTSLRNRHRNNPYPRLQHGSILVNTQGRRFADEIGLTKNALSNETARQPNAAAYVIFDERTKAIMARGYEIFLQEFPAKGRPRVPAGSLQSIEEHIIADGTLVRTATLAELAERLSLPYENLHQTIQEYNQAIDDGNPLAQEIPRSGDAYKLDTPPFYGQQVHSMLNCTLGGIKIGSGGHVLYKDGGVIPGLYAAGEIVGGFFYENYQMVCGYLPICLVLGRIAGKKATAEAH